MKELTLQKYRDLGDILTDSFQYLRIHFKSLGKGLLLFVLPFYLVSGFLVGNAYTSIFSVMLANPDVMNDSMFGGDIFLGFLLLALGSAALLTVTVKHVQLAQHTTEIAPTDLLEDFARNFFMLVALYIIIIIAVGFSFLFFIIPGVYVGVKLFIAPAAVILEDKNPFEAFGRSWDLTQGHWWFTFAVYLVMNIITSFMSYVLIIPFTLLAGFLSTSGAETSDGGLGTLMGLFYGLLIVIASLFSVLLLIAMCLQYFNLVERKEGKGLRAQIEELGEL